jgi:hypothetical protein
MRMPQAMQQGFETNFGYISGGNAIKEKIPMAAPVMVHEVDEGWAVAFFLGERTANPPTPDSAGVVLSQWDKPYRVAGRCPPRSKL